MNATDNLAALLREILANPDDDTVRLAYADCLQERGEPGDGERAEFIRVQVEIARRWETGDGVEWDAATDLLRRRERQLLDTHWLAWSSCPYLKGEDWQRRVTWIQECEHRFTRGFVSHVYCPAADWITNADRILSQHPVREVTLTTWPTTPYQDANHIWLTGRGKLKKFQLGKLGDDTRELILKGYWPEIKFTLPP